MRRDVTLCQLVVFTDVSKGRSVFFIFNDSSKRPSSRRNNAEYLKILQYRYANSNPSKWDQS
jgi:hypothetical protein